MIPRKMHTSPNETKYVYKKPTEATLSPLIHNKYNNNNKPNYITNWADKKPNWTDKEHDEDAEEYQEEYSDEDTEEWDEAYLNYKYSLK